MADLVPGVDIPPRPGQRVGGQPFSIDLPARGDGHLIARGQRLPQPRQPLIAQQFMHVEQPAAQRRVAGQARDQTHDIRPDQRHVLVAPDDQPAALRGLRDRLHHRQPAQLAGIGPAVALHQPTDDPLHPVVTWPELPRPLYLDLKAQSQDWMLPGLDRVPQNAISLLEPDPAFIEAMLAGFNHELGAEMLWRGFPTDRRGTPARTFWDRRGTMASGNTADIVPMHEWDRDLGTHAPADTAGPAGVVLLIRGDLLRRFPQTMIYGLPAKARAAGPDGEFPAPELMSDGDPRLPIFRGTLSPDVTFLGFDLTSDQVRADRTDGGWFFMIEGPPTEPRFGLDETLKHDDADFGRKFRGDRATETDLVAFDAHSVWDPIYWGDLLDPSVQTDRAEELDALTHIPVSLRGSIGNDDRAAVDPRLNTRLGGADYGGVVWGLSAAHMAAITLQLDVRIAFHADALIGAARP